MQMVRLAVAMVLSIAFPLVVQVADKRRMPPALRDRVWNVATWGASLYAFGPLSMLGWAWVTRPPGRRVWVGGLFTGATLAAVEAADVLVRLALHVPADPDASAAVDVGLVLAGGALGGAGLLGLFELVVAVRRRMH